MTEFMIHFFICNLFISGIIGILLFVKRILKNSLSARMQYHLWLLFLGLSAVPLIPLRPFGFSRIASWLGNLRTSPVSNAGIFTDEITNTSQLEAVNWMNDFAISVRSKTPSAVGLILCIIWTVGIVAMLLLAIKSKLRLNQLKKSALPLQNHEVRKLYHHCLAEMKLKKEIPIYSTAFLKSPVIVGYFKPCIYLPIHLISDYHASDMRYMLLHELQHYRHKDALTNHLMNIAGIIYWFNPFVWYALKEMRIDREIACDTSVLKMLKDDEYEDYGNTLINFAEKVSLTPFPFASGISGNMRQMKKRIINIASYEKPTFWKSFQGFAAFSFITIVLVMLAPILSTYAADGSHYEWNSSDKTISYVDFSNYFGEYDGSFVLYDTENDTWLIHNMEQASLRTSPDSTYKIYDALFGLEEGAITPEQSFIAWNQEIYPFESWNTDQTLSSAMSSSVNWYFQEIDHRLGNSCVTNYIREIGYGNENVTGDLSTYWLESSLKISPIEQVELFIKLYHNSFGFAPENIDAVKDSICLSKSEAGTFYGKTGTGRVDGYDVNGWFVGCIEEFGNVYYFAANIQGETDATGNRATEITMSILSDLQIWN